MQVMSTTATTAKWKFTFTRGLCWFLSSKVFIVEPKKFWTFLNVHSAISKSLTFAELSNLASHQIQSNGRIVHQRKTLPFHLPVTDSLHRFLVIIIMKTKNDFWGLILIVERDTYLEIPQFLNIHHKYEFSLSNITFGIYILNLFRKSSCPITSATVFFRMFP